MPPKKQAKASVDNSTTIRTASRNKTRSQQPLKSTLSPFGSSASGSLASSLNSLFSPQPHGKDAALASLLASSSKPQVELGGAAGGLAAFGSFGGQAHDGSANNKTVPVSLDEKLKANRKDASIKAGANESVSSTAKADVTVATASSKDAPNPSASNDTQQKQKNQANVAGPSTTSAATAPKPVIPNVPANRNPVFRPVLASSTAVTWPEMPVAGSKTVLHTLLEILAEPAVQAAVHRDLGRRSRASSSKTKQGAMEGGGDVMDVDGEPTTTSAVQVLAGINSITRAIEEDIAVDLQTLHNPASHAKGKSAAAVAVATSTRPKVKIVFVCRHDLPNPSLVAHLPMLVAARNAVLHTSSSSYFSSSSSSELEFGEGVMLFALPSGAQELLAKALNLRRASILALTTAFCPAQLSHLLTAIQRETGTVSTLRAGWLQVAMQASAANSALGIKSKQRLEEGLINKPTTMKLLRTTQPVDLNFCKAQKKLKRKDRSAKWKKRKLALVQRVKSLKAELRFERQKEKVARMKAKASEAQAKVVGMDTT